MDPTPHQVLHYEDIQHYRGLMVLEFGTNWCGHCQAAQPHIQAALRNFPHIDHVKIEDGKGKRLGRQFAVKLWPTLVLLKDGVEINRLVRPINVDMIETALLSLAESNAIS